MRDNRIRLALIAAFISSLFSMHTTGADDPPPITKKDLETSKSNLKQIAIAFENSHDTNLRIASNIHDKDNKPFLSWRVAILPYLDEEKLYKQFKLGEPWDSDNNKKLIEKMPKLYEPVRVRAKAGETYYQMFEGKGTPLSPNSYVNLTLAVISKLNGTSNTGLVYEAGTPVIWSKPADLPFDKTKPLPKLGGLFDGDFHVAMCDGSVHFLRKNPDEELMKYVISFLNTKEFDFKKLEK